MNKLKWIDFTMQCEYKQQIWYSTFKISNHADSLENVDISNKDDRGFPYNHLTFGSNLTRCTWFTVCITEGCVLHNKGILVNNGFGLSSQPVMYTSNCNWINAIISWKKDCPKSHVDNKFPKYLRQRWTPTFHPGLWKKKLSTPSSELDAWSWKTKHRTIIHWTRILGYSIIRLLNISIISGSRWIYLAYI